MNDKSDILRVIGNNVQRARLSKGLTQEALSDRIDKTPNFISIIERGESGISIPTIIDICNALKIDVSVIFKGLIDVDNPSKVEPLTKSILRLDKDGQDILTDLINYMNK